LIKEHKGVAYSISCTTRAPRGEEQDGRDYYFLTQREFKLRARRGEFLEYAHVHGHAYGTLKQSVEFAMEEGMHIIMDIDVQGVSQLRSALAEMDENSVMRQGFVDIFLQPPSLDELSRRLHKRGTDNPQVIAQRLERAKGEMECASAYTHVIVNDHLEAAYDQLVALTVSRV
jgi:guanylate kinase